MCEGRQSQPKLDSDVARNLHGWQLFQERRFTMKQVATLWLVVAAVAVLAAVQAQAEEAAVAAGIQAANKKLGRGINIGNALEAPKEGEWGVTLQAEYFRAIKEAGFDTIRLPICWSARAGAAAPYAIDPQFAERIDWAIEQALANRLNIIVNVHHYEKMDARPDEHLPRLVGLWEQIAARYRDRPAGVYFELLNEPHDKLSEEKWNAVIPAVLKAVRKTNPTRPVIVGPAQWNGIWALDKLELPRDDRNLIVTVHCYDPTKFTHQGAPWLKEAAGWKGQKWTGGPAEQEALRKQFEKAAAWGKKHGRPIFLGEFGTCQEADMESRARWTRFVRREAETLGLSWAYWEFCAGFGAYDSKAGAWRAPLKGALLDK
jgi:endoglucanase